MAEVNHPKELRKQNILYKVTWISHEEEDFIGVEVMMVAEEDLMCVSGVVYRVINNLNAQIITCKIQSKDNNLVWTSSKIRMKKEELNMKSRMMWGRVSWYRGQWWFPKKSKGRVMTMNILGFEQIFFKPYALLGERYVTLLLIVEVVRIWFPKRW